MLFLEKAFLPIFVFLATISGLAFGSMIPIMFLVLPVLVTPLLIYGYTQVYRQKYKLLADDSTLDLQVFSSSALEGSNKDWQASSSVDQNSVIIESDAFF